MSIKIYKDGKWQLFPGTGVGGSTNSYTKEESDNKYALKSDVTAVSGKVDDLEERIDQISTGGNCEDCISQSELESAISGVNSKIDNLVTAVSGKVDTGSYLFTLNGDQVNQGDSVNVAGSGTSITIDSALDINSENPVQNKVVTSKLNYLESGLSLHGEEISYIETRVGNYELANDQKNIVSGSTQISWKHITKDSPLYLKTINGISIIGNSEDNNITISGGSGTVTESKPSVIVFAYIQSNEKPISEPNVTVDSEGNPTYTGEWKSISDMSDAISNKLQIWYSYATFVVGSNIVGSWSDPIPFAKDGLPGQDGTPGKDGTDGIGVEYIYYRSNDNVIPSLPANANSWEWDNVPENAGGWTDNPTGVDKDHQFEFVSVRTGNATNINPWSLPTLWSKYGVNGVDGDTIEYIYALTTDITIQPSTPDNSWEYDNPQLPWHDNPQSVSESDKVCWVSVRKKSGNSDTWGDWSTPAVWSKWSEDGKTPDAFYSALVNIYKRADSLPAKPADGEYIYNFKTGKITSDNLNNWSIDIPNNTAKYLYQCSAYVTSNNTTGVINSWSDPICIASNGENGSGQSAVYLDLTNDSSYLVTDINGKVEKEQVINTTLHMYYGTTEQTLTDCFVEGHTNDANVSVNNDTVNKCANISITYPVNTTISDSKLEYTIQAKSIIDGSAVTKTIGFIVVVSKPAESGKDAVMYNIVPSATVIKLDSTGEDYIPSELSITVVKVEGAVSNSLSAEQITNEGLSLKYRLDNGDEINAPNWALSFVKNSLDLVGSITFNLYKGTECIDTETVPVLRDGKNGDKGDKGDPGQNGTNGTSPVLLGVDNDHLFIAVDNNGYAVADQTLVFYVHLYDGNTEVDTGDYDLSFNPASATGYTISSQDNANLNATGKIVTVNITTEYHMPVTGIDEYSIINVSANQNGKSVASSNVIVRYSNASWFEIVPDTYTIHVDQNSKNPSPSTLGVTVYHELITQDIHKRDAVSVAQLKAWKYRLICVNDISETNKVEYIIVDGNSNNNTDTKFNIDLTDSRFNFNYPIKITLEDLEHSSDPLDAEYLTIVKDGANGDAGSNGYTQVLLQIYQRSADTPSNPGQVTFNLEEGTWAVPTNWNKTIPEVNGKPCWLSTAFINSNKSTGTVSVDWSNPVKLVEDGKTGSEGRALYAAGLWNSITEYKRTTNFTPYVLWKGKYYVLIKGDTISGTTTEPGTETGNMWQEMTSMDVVYARVLMTEMGTIGDATFYNNLMFSKKDAKGNQVIDKGENNPFETVNGTTTIKMSSSNKPTMAIDFNSGETYFANGNIRFFKSGDTIVKNIIYDISETVPTEASKLLSGTIGSFTYTFYPINNVNTYIDTGVLQSSTGQDKLYFVFKFSDDYTIYGDQACEFIEGVVINSGENIAHITAGVYDNDGVVVKPMKFYHQGHIDFAEIDLAPHSILKYFYHPLDQTNSDYSGEIYIQGDNYTSFGSTPSAGILYVGGSTSSL